MGDRVTSLLDEKTAVPGKSTSDYVRKGEPAEKWVHESMLRALGSDSVPDEVKNDFTKTVKHYQEKRGLLLEGQSSPDGKAGPQTLGALKEDLRRLDASERPGGKVTERFLGQEPAAAVGAAVGGGLAIPAAKAGEAGAKKLTQTAAATKEKAEARRSTAKARSADKARVQNSYTSAMRETFNRELASPEAGKPFLRMPWKEGESWKQYRARAETAGNGKAVDEVAQRLRAGEAAAGQADIAKARAGFNQEHSDPKRHNVRFPWKEGETFDAYRERAHAKDPELGRKIDRVAQNIGVQDTLAKTEQRLASFDKTLPGNAPKNGIRGATRETVQSVKDQASAVGNKLATSTLEGGSKTLKAVAPIVGAAGKIAVPVGVAMSAYTINEAHNADLARADGKYTETGKAVASEAGGWAGAAGGAMAGAALGTAFIPIPIVGTTIGAIGGGIAGYFGGSWAGQELTKERTGELVNMGEVPAA